VQLGDEAPLDVVEAIRSLPIQPDCDAEGAKVVELGLDALEQPSADDVAAKVVAALAQQPKKIARYGARHLQRLKAKPRDPLRAQQLGDEIAQKLLEKTPPPETIAQAVAIHLPKVDESKLAAVVVRRLLPLFGGGAAVLVATVGVFLHYQYAPYQPSPDGHIMTGHDREVRPPLALGQHRLPLWDWQDRPPCSDAARELDGGCWLPLKYKPPCPKESWEKNGECWVPAAGRDQKRPPQAGDGPQSPGPAQIPK
jgi:hypothetical protein